MRLIILYLFILLFLSGCGSGSTTDNQSTTIKDTYFYQQWYLNSDSELYAEYNIDSNSHINFNSLSYGYSGKNIKIAIIDDGVDTTHEDLTNTIFYTYDINTQTSDVSHTNSNDYHGTAITGLISANMNNKGIYGLANSSEIIFLKYKDSMSDSETIELFNKAEEFGADIINCSWGTYNVSQLVKEKIQDLAINGRDGKGTLIVFAAGNDDSDMGNDESAIPEVISVSSTNKFNVRAWYSNYGENLDVMAPGGYDIGLTTLDPMGTNGISLINDNYNLINDSNSFIGTSASAPLVTATLALILEYNPNLTRENIIDILKNSSDKIGTIPYTDGKNNYYGYGKINLENIFKYTIENYERINSL